MEAFKIIVSVKGDDFEDCIESMQPVVNEVVEMVEKGMDKPEVSQFEGNLVEVLAVLGTALIVEAGRLREFRREGDGGREL